MPIDKPDLAQEEQEKILRAKEEWERTFDAVSDLIFITDTNHTIVRVNRAMAERFGLTPKGVVGRKCFEVMHGTKSVPDECPYRGSFERGVSQTLEFNVETLDGTFEATMSPVMNSKGQVTACVHVARDVTKKRRIEKALQESEQRFSVFMEHLPLAVTISDEHGKILFANEYFKDLLGVEDPLGLTAKDLYPPDVSMKMQHDDQDALTRGLGLYKDVIRDNDGYELNFDTYKFPIPLSDGTTLLGTISCDVTEKRRQEALLSAQQKQLEEINLSLESRIEKAVVELRKKDNILIQQSRLNSMGEMISNIAHQWRQPLNNIGLIVQGLQLAFKANDLSEQELDENIADTMKVLHQISETIDDFRNFFSHEEEVSSFIVNEQVSRALSFIEPSLKRKGISIELDEQPDVTAVGYPNEYVQALLNIILNARDALSEHQVENPAVGIRIFEENGHAILTVRDNGGGISEDVIHKIFDPYFTTRTQSNGTGIGLYMSKMIIEKNMNGRLTVSNIDGGAEFRIEV